jgi:protein associated with RNAse G/E
MVPATIIVHKRDHMGRETWQYAGQVLERGETWVLLEARFNVPGEHDEGYVIFRFQDRFVEHFFSDRWYNIWEVHGVADDRLKGWYCNIGRPSKIELSDIFFDDLALDVWVDPTGKILVVDEEEFAVLAIDTSTRAHALATVDAVRSLVASRVPPFDQIA